MEESINPAEKKMSSMSLAYLIFMPFIAAFIFAGINIPILSPIIFLIYTIICIPYSFRKLKHQFSVGILGRTLRFLYVLCSFILCFSGVFIINGLIIKSYNHNWSQNIGEVSILLSLSIVLTCLLIFAPICNIASGIISRSKFPIKNLPLPIKVIGLSTATALIVFSFLHLSKANNIPDKIYLPFKPTFPYQAKTTDECIHERECAWYYFVKFQERVPENTKKEYGDKLSEDDKNPAIKKWKTPLHFLILPQENNQEYRDQLETVLARVSPHFPYDIKITNDKVTAVLMFSDDFKRDLFGTYKSFFSKMFGPYLFKEYGSFEITQPTINFRSFPFHDKEHIIFGTAVFIKPDNSVINSSLESNIFYNLGFTGLSFMTPFFPADNHNKMTGLHFFLLRMLYHPDMKEGTRLSDSQITFNRIYPDVLKGFDDYNSMKKQTKSQ